ncbi:MAG: bifunctional methylenetetrahydrofolate dehydrogenase/methenyltetrahydrofolate cyclohydrolase FolD [Paludibacteraceae bacterium]|nr:bifunctional methylenetetrahydrofolate dehydrogenase/methenyltetrahydrofolate cyclohydrolase FolD [Paludibacteraceae bacterium]
MIIDGKAIAQQLKDEVREQVETLTKQYGRKPCLDVIIVGENPASMSYVKSKIKATEYCGFDGELIQLPESTSQDELLRIIRSRNENEMVDGILVQLPLPKHIDEQSVIEAIAQEKDVDGFHPTNVAKLWLNQETIVPCTPMGIMALLAKSGTPLEGRHAVVVGRSNIVGKPIAKLLLDKNCTVTIAHSRTADLGAICREADILVVAVGKAKMIKGDMVKPGATVIDVGINRMEDGKIAGDVDFDSVAPVAGAITPVPGGVGPMTISMLMYNTLKCYNRRMSNLCANQ